MALPSPIADELVDLIAWRFRLLAEPTRIRLLDSLRDGEATVHELTAELGTSQQNVSKHLTLLAEAGMLTRRKDRNSVYYRIVDPGVLGLCDEDVLGDGVEQPVTADREAEQPLAERAA